MRRALAATAIAVALSSPVVARAQAQQDVARADTLFNAAKALLESGQYAEACAQFAESKRLAPGLGVTLYLADCYERVGRTASAWMEFRSAEGLARARNDKRADVAHERAQTLEPNLVRLTISVAPTVPLAGLQVLRDGHPVSQEEWGLAVPVDPGDHTIVVSSPGRAPRTIIASVAPDNPDAVVRIDGLDAGANTSPPSAPGSASESQPSPPPGGGGPEPEDTTPSSNKQRWIALGVGGVGVVGLGLGTVFGLMAKSKLDESNSGGASAPCDTFDHCNAHGLSLRQDASSAATISTVAVIAGGVALAGAVVLYLTAPRDPASGSVSVAAGPVAGGGAGVVRLDF